MEGSRLRARLMLIVASRDMHEQVHILVFLYRDSAWLLHAFVSILRTNTSLVFTEGKKKKNLPSQSSQWDHNNH